MLNQSVSQGSGNVAEEGVARPEEQRVGRRAGKCCLLDVTRLSFMNSLKVCSPVSDQKVYTRPVSNPAGGTNPTQCVIENVNEKP